MYMNKRFTEGQTCRNERSILLYTNADADLVEVCRCGGNKLAFNELHVPKSKIQKSETGKRDQNKKKTE